MFGTVASGGVLPATEKNARGEIGVDEQLGVRAGEEREELGEEPSGCQEDRAAAGRATDGECRRASRPHALVPLYSPSPVPLFLREAE